MQQDQTFIDKCYKDKNGKVVLAQTPNLPILLWAVTALLTRFLFESGTVHTALSYAGFGLLFTWCWLEIFQGVNYFRRVLGFVILAALLWSRAQG